MFGFIQYKYEPCPYCDMKIYSSLYDEHILVCFKAMEDRIQNQDFPCDTCAKPLNMDNYFDHMMIHYDEARLDLHDD